MSRDVHEDVKRDDTLLEVVVCSIRKMPDVLLHDGVKGSLKMSTMTLLLEDVDKVNGLNDVDVLDSPTVLDEQGDVEVSLCDLL